MQTRIVFTANGSSSAAGNFAPGDALTCSPELARHLVEEACCARYDGVPLAADERPPKPSKSIAPRKRNPKESV